MHSEALRDHELDRDRPADRCATALAVACPVCIALPGEPCMPMGLAGPHWARIQVVRGGRR